MDTFVDFQSMVSATSMTGLEYRTPLEATRTSVSYIPVALTEVSDLFVAYAAFLTWLPSRCRMTASD